MTIFTSEHEGCDHTITEDKRQCLREDTTLCTSTHNRDPDDNTATTLTDTETTVRSTTIILSSRLATPESLTNITFIPNTTPVVSVKSRQTTLTYRLIISVLKFENLTDERGTASNYFHNR
ncbi:hypothetical protein RclHR1_15840004 [Rhizophagus clarus]|uniref:Uncharacterized protein n=1 Tax=Rhizophagus clarus TaxID=94130 RepID=A0A2Z6QK89_9GLOM|nr:hypothetical protein RclHR1_15840004 [Rhizophagus clarus]GES95118.1 hypothetical protein RCL_jg19324.t1 [Rhizophagus clarus]